LLGRINFEEENYTQAKEYFTKLTEENPKNRYGWIFLVVIYNRENNDQKSLQILQQSLTILPEDVDLLAMYGSKLSELGRDEEALKPLKRALKLDPENISTISSIAAVYDKVKMWQESDSLYERALYKNPDNALLLNNYSYSLTQRNIRINEALEMVTKALEIEPDNGAYLDTKGWIYYKMGHYEDALKYILKAVEKREDSAEVLEHLGDIYLKLNNLPEAKKYWEKALDKDPLNTELEKKIQSL